MKLSHKSFLYKVNESIIFFTIHFIQPSKKFLERLLAEEAEAKRNILENQKLRSESQVYRICLNTELVWHA